MRCVTLWALEVKVTLHSESLSHPISIDPTLNMGQYEVTPVVYEQLFLRTKRYGQNAVFLSPTMLHHKKNFDKYKVLASTCVSSCVGLTAAKGFITDGKEELSRAWKTELPKATHLRCIHHFQSNCNKKTPRDRYKRSQVTKSFSWQNFRNSRENGWHRGCREQDRSKRIASKCKRSAWRERKGNAE